MTSTQVFIINLKRSLERRNALTKWSEDKKFPVEFFEAVDGKNGHQLFERYDHLKRLWLTSGKTMTPGELGCFASHFLLWEKCVELNKPIIIVEDDAIMCENPQYVLDLLSCKIEKYGYIRLEECIDGYLIPVEQNFDITIYKMSWNYFATSAYAISPEAAKRFIEKADKWSVAVDNYIGEFFNHGVESYQSSVLFVKRSTDFPSEIGIERIQRSPLYVKPSRAIYRFIKECRRILYNRRFIRMNKKR